MRSSPPANRLSDRRGIALLSVLIVIVLVTALIIGFLVRAGTQRVAAANYSASANANMLANTAINFVEAQINEATTVPDPTNPLFASAWATQPGAISVFDETNTGVPKTIYRLYSASARTDTSLANLTADLPSNTSWAQQPALWTDLNAPVSVSGLTDSSGASLTPVGATGYPIYPILDPRDPTASGNYLLGKPDEWGTTPVATQNWGFSIGNNVTTSTAATTATNVGFTGATPVLPMRWLYVLADSELVVPTSTDGINITVSGTTKTDPTTGKSIPNPIVGRIAFWTDDETCKVNINTAAGSRSNRPDPAQSGNTVPLPASWDTPRLDIWDERLLFAEDQPVHNEYQRYPGHPATTDLYNIFNALGMVTATDYPPNVTVSNPIQVQTALNASPNTASAFFSLFPRYTDINTSRGGTRDTTLTTGVGTTLNVAAKGDRLYTSLGEMLYNQARGATGVTRQQVESGKFFLTTHSRAPDVTLFGTPRVSMWPVNSSTTLRTPYDVLSAFCETTGPAGGKQTPYYFQRSDSTNPTNDYNNSAQNSNLFTYLHNLTSQNIPGFGTSFSSKYSGTASAASLNTATESDQILTEMIDYIRSTNTQDRSLPNTSANQANWYTGSLNINQAQVIPLNIVRGTASTQGLGRYNTLSEIGVQIICTGDGNSPLGTYQTPVNKGFNAPVSPVAGSAYDPQYASNLLVAQFLADGSGNAVDINGAMVTSSTSATLAYPANQTLTGTTGNFGSSLVALKSGEKRLQSILLTELACPMMGPSSMLQNYDGGPTPNFQMNVTNLEKIGIAGMFPFPSRSFSVGTATLSANQNGDGVYFVRGSRNDFLAKFGGILGFRFPMTAYNVLGQGTTATAINGAYNSWSGVTPDTQTVTSPNIQPTASNFQYPYRYISNPFTVTAGTTGSTMAFGGTCNIALQTTNPAVAGATPVVYQTFNVTFNPTTVPVPELINWGLSYGSYYTLPAEWWGFDNRIAWLVPSFPSSVTRLQGGTEPYYNQAVTPYLGFGCMIRTDLPFPPTTNPTHKWVYSSTYQQIPVFNYASANVSPNYYGDVVRTLVAKDGDYRLIAAKNVVNATDGGDFQAPTGYYTTAHLCNMFVDQQCSNGTAGANITGKLTASVTYPAYENPKVPPLSSSQMKSWHWDNGLPKIADGAYSNKPDEGNIYTGGYTASSYAAGYDAPYYNGDNQVSSTSYDLTGYFTANRIINSAVMFGSLPTGTLEGITWRTLLFRPQPSGSNDLTSGPKDYLYLDLFNMPILEPYAISEPFSTAGRINMNYQIQPFSFITRDTGVRAVLYSELISDATNSTAASFLYKSTPTSSTQNPSLTLEPIFLDETLGTLKQFESKFSAGQLFRSPAEICDMYLVPRGGETLNTFGPLGGDWYSSSYALVGDNTRDRPYGDIYPRLTTKSNTFTVHYRVQALSGPNLSKGQWAEGHGSIAGEYRGSTTIERFIDPTKAVIPDYTTSTAFSTTVNPLDNFYQWRVISNNRFAP